MFTKSDSNKAYDHLDWNIFDLVLQASGAKG